MPIPEHREGHATLEKAPTTWSARRPRRAADSQTQNKTASQAAITYARSEPSRQNRQRCYPWWRTSSPSIGVDDRQPSEGNLA